MYSSSSILFWYGEKMFISRGYSKYLPIEMKALNKIEVNKILNRQNDFIEIFKKPRKSKKNGYIVEING
jgi:hypothetical protein